MLSKCFGHFLASRKIGTESDGENDLGRDPDSPQRFLSLSLSLRTPFTLFSSWSPRLRATFYRFLAAYTVRSSCYIVGSTVIGRPFEIATNGRLDDSLEICKISKLKKGIVR